LIRRWTGFFRVTAWSRNQLVEDLPITKRQMVEIAMAFTLGDTR
jgi:ABC-type sugar transport system ATPase subunit